MTLIFGTTLQNSANIGYTSSKSCSLIPALLL